MFLSGTKINISFIIKKMEIIYVTLNNNDEARKIGRQLLEKKLANCVNFFPITCMYNWENEITEEQEVVLIIKTKSKNFNKIEKVIKSFISYTNFIGMLEIGKINNGFEAWLNDIVK